MIVGTPHYMSPEQDEGRPADARSDQFSLAVTCWETLYGSLPFPGDSLDTIREAVFAQRIAVPPDGNGVPDAVREALRRGMGVSASARYPSMSAFVERLKLASI